MSKLSFEEQCKKIDQVTSDIESLYEQIKQRGLQNERTT